MSCHEWIEEEYYGTQNATLENYVNASYVMLKDWYGKEIGYDLGEAGTDLFTWGSEHKLREMLTYDPEFDAENPLLCVLWNDLYTALESCNAALKYLDENKSGATNEDIIRWKSEVHVLRAHYLWIISETWGDVHFTTESSVRPEYEANSTPVDVFHRQIIQDLNFAVNHLSIQDNTRENDYGRVTKLVAIAFRARMHLTQGNYAAALNDADSAIYLGTSYYGLDLMNDNNELWTVEKSEDNSEIIWALNYSTGKSAAINLDYEEMWNLCGTVKEIYHWESYNGAEHKTNGGGGFWGHLYFTMAYDEVPGMERKSYNRPYRRFIPTLYFIDLFNDLDQRYESTFRFAYYANNVDDPNIPRWPAYEEDSTEYIPDGSTSGDLIYTPSTVPFMGDTAIYLTNKEIDDDYLVNLGKMKIHRYGHYIVLDRDMLYNNDSTPRGSFDFIQHVHDRQIYIGLKKFADPTIESGKKVEGSTRSGRDAMLIRLAEMYLIAAESCYKLNSTGNEGGALAYLEILYTSRAANHNGYMLLQAYGINSVNDLSNDFFLEERARELSGEQLRWFDLRRMDNNYDDFNMVEWIKSKNPDTRLMKDYHKIRPIPQTQINAMRNPELYYEKNAPYTTLGN